MEQLERLSFDCWKILILYYSSKEQMVHASYWYHEKLIMYRPIQNLNLIEWKEGETSDRFRSQRGKET